MIRGDLIPYTCSVCHGVTYDKPGLTAVICSKCGRIDLGTEVALQRWKTVAEIVRDNTPTVVTVHHEHASLRAVVSWALLAAAVAVVAYFGFLAVAL